ncbi:MAG: NAD(P)H-dependent glycerol-3-phosphate dehydrogenase [Pseudomonadota bacterium]
MASTSNRVSACVIGAGSWGTALAHHLAGLGHQVRLWAFEPPVAAAINQQHENTLYLPGAALNPAIEAHHDLASALAGAGLVLLVMPSHVFRAVLSQAAPHLPLAALVVSCTKGIEQETSYTMCEVAEEVLDKSLHRRLCCLSGPSFAKEVALGVPTAVTVASRVAEAAQRVQLALASAAFRVYTSPDLPGVELGGAVKNPLAIAAGMVAGLTLGHNTLAALITRGLAEMTRLAMARGGQPTTLSGLAGLGDLVLTCTSPQSRNYSVGARLAQGETIEQITSSMPNVAEGVRNTRTVLGLAEDAQVEMPIIQAVYRVIYQGQHPRQALHELMTRDLKAEHCLNQQP